MKVIRYLPFVGIICIVLLVFAARVEAISGNVGPYEEAENRGMPQTSLSANQNDTHWPQPVGFHSIGGVEMTVTSVGNFGGSNMSISIDPETGRALRTFTFPRGSRHSYLWGAGLWVGGVINGDTLVSMGMSDAYYSGSHYLPVDSGGSVTLVSGPGDKQFKAEYDDNFPPPVWQEPDFRKLNSIHVTETSRSWTYSPNDNFILVELEITNIGEAPIQDAYVGLYVDADVMDSNTPLGYSDDLAGYIRSEGIAYIMDNDGDPHNNVSWDDNSIRGAIGAGLVYSDPPAADTSFNWWDRISPNYGPQYLGNPPQEPRYMADGELGNPINANDRYYLMSNDEIDYDQMFAAVINSDSGWLPAGTSGPTLAIGIDTRFVIGYGPYQIAPGDSVHVVVAFTAGRDVHQNPWDYHNRFDYQNPANFYGTLDFSDLIENFRAARLLYESDYALALRPGEIQGLQITETGQTSAEISWLPKNNVDIEGYNVYIKPVPDSQVIFRDTVYRYDVDTAGMTLANTNGPVTDTSYALDGLTDGQTYFVSVTAVNFFSESPRSRPRYFTPGTPEAPVTQPGPTYIGNVDEVTIHWTPPPLDDIDHYNIYRYIGAYDYSLRYKPRITTRPIDGRPYDSLHVIVNGDDTARYYFYGVAPYAQVSAPDTILTDPITDAELYYLVTAVDDAGQESDTSRSIPIYATSYMPNDILILLENTGDDRNLESIDTVINYYNDVLSDFTVDYFIMADSAQGYICDNDGCHDVCLNKECFSWSAMAPYRFVVIDENLLKPIIDRYNFIVPFNKILRDYIRSGGTVIYFGNFANAVVPYGLDTLTRRFSPGSKEYDLFGLDSVFTNGVGLYFNHMIGNGVDTIGGFVGTTALTTAFDNLQVDTTYDWWNFPAQQTTFWPYATPPQTAVMYPRGGAEAIYTYEAVSPQTSLFEGFPCGIRFNAYGRPIYAFGFHPWYLPRSQSAALFSAIMDDHPTGVDDPSKIIPDRFVLHQNYPNPFNPTTTITYSLPRSADVQIDIYNILGRRVIKLVDEFQKAGNHSIQWNGRDNHGNEAASGIYFYRISAGDKVRSRKMLLLK